MTTPVSIVGAGLGGLTLARVLHVQSEAADAYLILELCLGDRAPFGLIEFFTGAPAGEHEGAAQS